MLSRRVSAVTVHNRNAQFNRKLGKKTAQVAIINVETSVLMPTLALSSVPVDKPAPNHSTISRTRRLIDIETHSEVFNYILKMLANHGLIDGKTAGVDSTTLEANAAMRSIVRRDSGEGYQKFLTRLAKESGIYARTISSVRLAGLEPATAGLYGRNAGH